MARNDLNFDVIILRAGVFAMDVKITGDRDEYGDERVRTVRIEGILTNPGVDGEVSVTVADGNETKDIHEVLDILDDCADEVNAEIPAVGELDDMLYDALVA